MVVWNWENVTNFDLTFKRWSELKEMPKKCSFYKSGGVQEEETSSSTSISSVSRFLFWYVVRAPRWSGGRGPRRRWCASFFWWASSVTSRRRRSNGPTLWTHRPCSTPNTPSTPTWCRATSSTTTTTSPTRTWYVTCNQGRINHSPETSTLIVLRFRFIRWIHFSAVFMSGFQWYFRFHFVTTTSQEKKGEWLVSRLEIKIY